MNKIKLLNKIAKVGTDEFDTAKYEIGTDLENPDAIMVRSAAMHDMEFNPELLAIARAGAGVNNIPVDRCADAGIVVFNTPGANANGVKELAIAALLLASRDIVDGVQWSKTLAGHELGVAKAVEKGKSAFAGQELSGKTLGVIGLGAIGAMVANTAVSLGMKVIGCDPYITVDGAWHLSRSIVKANNYDEIFAKADYITMHVPSTPETKNMFCAEAFAKMKDGVRIINLSRADLVNSADIKAAIAEGKVAKYVTDFPTEDTINEDNIITIPHLGASTEESEDNCAVMAATELIDYIASEGEMGRWDIATLELGINVLEWEEEKITKRVENTLKQIAGRNQDKAVFVISPFYNDDDYKNIGKSEKWRTLIEKAVDKFNYRNVTYINGLDLLGDMSLISADEVHPNIYGVSQIAKRLEAEIKKGDKNGFFTLR